MGYAPHFARLAYPVAKLNCRREREFLEPEKSQIPKQRTLNLIKPLGKGTNLCMGEMFLMRRDWRIAGN